MSTRPSGVPRRSSNRPLNAARSRSTARRSSPSTPMSAASVAATRSSVCSPSTTRPARRPAAGRPPASRPSSGTPITAPWASVEASVATWSPSTTRPASRAKAPAVANALSWSDGPSAAEPGAARARGERGAGRPAANRLVIGRPRPSVRASGPAASRCSRPAPSTIRQPSSAARSASPPSVRTPSSGSRSGSDHQPTTR